MQVGSGPKGPTSIDRPLRSPKVGGHVAIALPTHGTFKQRLLERLGLGRKATPQQRARVLGLAIPIIGAMISQNILNLVDTAMVGSLGDSALAAVGLGGFATLMSVALFMGFSSAVQAISSRRVGEGRRDETAHPLNGALLLSIVAGIPAALALYHIAPWLMGLLNADSEVLALAVPYYQVRVLAVIAVGMNLAFSGFWNGTDRSKVYMKTLWFMHACNVLLNYIFIFGKFGAPALGATGAALGTTISLYLGSAAFMVLGWKKARQNGFLARRPRAKTLRVLVRLLLPGGFQQFFFWAGMTALNTIVGLVGTPELAATSVLINLVLTMILIQVGFGLAAGTLAGQSLGAQKIEEARTWVRTVIQISLGLTTPLMLAVLVAPKFFLAAFIQDPQTLALAANPLRLIALTFLIDCFGVVYLNSLQGVGDQKTVMIVLASCQWLIFLPLAYLAGPVLGLGLSGIWAAHLLYRGAQACLLHTRWQGDRWTTLKV